MEEFIRENEPTVDMPSIDMENARRNCSEINTNEHRLIDYNSERRLFYCMYKSHDNKVYIFTVKSNLNSYSESIIEYCLYNLLS
jgi:hypothetical protein